MDPEQNQSDRPTRFSFKHGPRAIVTGVVAVIGFVVLLGCLSYGAQIAGGIFLGILMSSSRDLVLHSDPNPGDTIVVHVISDDCGATCDCATRLDISFGGETRKRVYRVHDACDLEIRWLDDYRFEVIDKWGETVTMDARDFENSPP